MRRGRPPYPGLLTPREQEVLRFLREGLTNREIAERLGISLNGARYHVSEILSKLGVSTREEAARWRPDSVPLKRRLLGWVTPGLALKAGASTVVATASLILGLLALGVLAMNHRGEVDSEQIPLETLSGPIVSGPMGKLVYVDDGDIWTKDLPDGTPRRLTTDSRSFAPRWSPSGEWILFRKPVQRAAGQEFVMRANGTELRQVSAMPGTVSWSPVEDRLTYVEGYRLVVEDPDGSNRVTLVDRPASERFTVAAPRWSPDGQWVAYALEQSLADPRSVDCCGRAYVGLWASRVDGSEHRELLGDAGPPRAGVVVAGWTPDSRQILFSRSTTFSASQAADGLSWQMTPLNPDDPANPQSVTTHYQVLNYDDYTHSSSDGRLLVGIHGDGREATLNKSLFVLDTGSPNLGSQLTGNGVAASSPALSPDGSTIAYVQQPEGAFQDSTGERRIWLIEPDGTNPRRLTQNAVAEERPQWSADGRFILYVRIDSSAWPATTMESNPGGRVSLWRHELATGREEMLLDGIEFYTNAVNTNIGYFGHYDWDSIFDWHQ